MTKKEIIEDIISYINDEMGYPVELTEKSFLSDAGLDSLDLVDLRGRLESTYNVDIELINLQNTIGNIAKFIMCHGSQD